jgi:hypothetical protein
MALTTAGRVFADQLWRCSTATATATASTSGVGDRGAAMARGFATARRRWHDRRFVDQLVADAWIGA